MCNGLAVTEDKLVKFQEIALPVIVEGGMLALENTYFGLMFNVIIPASGVQYELVTIISPFAAIGAALNVALIERSNPGNVEQLKAKVLDF